MTITIQDIAAKSGFSVATVSQTLSNHPKSLRFHKETRQRIYETARELNYRPSFVGQALRRGKTMTLALMVGGIRSPFFSEVADIALHAAEERGYHLIVSVTAWNPEKEEDVLRMLMDGGRADGVLVLAYSFRPGSAIHQHIVQQHFPIVTLVDCGLPDVSMVVPDFTPGMQQAVTCLKERGHRKIVYITDRGELVSDDQLEPRTSKERVFIATCRQHGVEPVVRRTDVAFNSAMTAGRRLVPDGFTAAIVNSDYAAIGVIKGVRQGGHSVPRDIDIIGIDGIEWGQICEPSLTTIVNDLKTTIDTALDLLLKRIDKRDLPPVQLVIPTHLRMGQSVRELSL